MGPRGPAKVSALAFAASPKHPSPFARSPAAPPDQYAGLLGSRQAEQIPAGNHQTLLPQQLRLAREAQKPQP